MTKKHNLGFTLVELLAVIVILAIISLIAIPIVIDMINNSKEKSNKEGLKLYMDTVAKRIANSNLDVLYNPDTCTIQSTGDLLCLKDDEELYVDEEKINKILEIKMNGKKPSEGTLYFTDGKITTGENIKYNDLYYTITNGVVSKGSNEKTDIITGVIARIKNSVGNISGTCEIQNATTMVCGSEIKTIQQSGHKATEGKIVFNNGEVTSYKNIKMEGKYYHNQKEGKTETEDKQYLCTQVLDADNSNSITIGDEYSCEVKVGTDETFKFYVLTAPTDGKVNMIMDNHICNDGSKTYTSQNNYCRYKWYSTEDNNTYGPITAMQELYEGTKEWNNLDSIELNYIDENNTSSDTNGYVGMVINNGVVTITGKPNTNITILGENGKPLRARLPRKSEINDILSKGSCPEWLKYNKEGYQYTFYGYWLLSSTGNSSSSACSVHSSGYIRCYDGTRYSAYVIRPVITVKTSDMRN